MLHEMPEKVRPDSKTPPARPKVPLNGVYQCTTEIRTASVPLLFCQRRINFLDGSVGHFLNVVLRTTIVIFADLFSFSSAFTLSFASRRTLRTETRPCSASPRTTLMRSLRRSSVSGGSGTRMSAPAELGFRPRSEAMIAFSTAGLIERSKTLIFSVRVSSTVTLAS